MLAALGTAVGVCRIGNKNDADKAQDENLSANAVVEKTIRIMDMPTTGIRPSGRGTAAKGYVVLVGGEAANYKTRRIDYIQNRMKPVYSYVKSEYAAYMVANPGTTEGNITVRFTITAQGGVINPEIISDSIGSPEFRAKVLSQVALWKIDPVETGVVKVVYKFNFWRWGSYGNLPVHIHRR
ncbi:MAG: AgmX/PglI C-terminal domain-containing protein [candidate division Zixibacteria bacterium]|nr:AgmX/PglI C-terminal domain-containing protein [candidate division Zixibacteria bacterium]